MAEEVLGCIELVQIIFDKLGMEDYRVRVGLRDLTPPMRRRPQALGQSRRSLQGGCTVARCGMVEEKAKPHFTAQKSTLWSRT